MTDFKNLEFKYVKVTGGSSSIDPLMTDKKFLATKPAGYFYCFIIPKKYFIGHDYKTLQNFISIEINQMWNQTNRDTFLGYCEETNEFIVNLNGYMGLKDSDLKTSGDIPHSGQASWHTMILSSSKTSDSIITMKQTDGSDVYLSVKNLLIEGQVVSGRVCVEVIKKKVSGTTAFVKNNGSVWVKSPEDNSAVMIRDKCPKIVGSNTYVFKANNRLFTTQGYVPSKDFQQVSIYGKPVVYFEDSSNSSKARIHGYYGAGRINNLSGKSFVDYTETSNLEDILSSGESLTFGGYPVQQNYWCSKDSKTNKGINANTIFNDQPFVMSVKSYGEVKDIESYSAPTVKGMELELRSYDTRKPFVYIPQDRGFTVNSLSSIDLNSLVNKLPDGFIACIAIGNKMYRYKNGDKNKYKSISSVSSRSFVEITGTTIFGNNMFNYGNSKFDKISISKDDLLNSTGFTDSSGSDIQNGGGIPYFISATIMRI